MSDNLKASLLMIVSMAGFGLQDVFIKFLAVDVPAGQIVFLIGTGGFSVLAAVALARRVPLATRGFLAPSIMLRNIFEFTCAICLVTALALVELSLVTAIMQAAPLIVTAGAALWFGERVGWRRWVAIAVGFAGVLVILRPGMAGFEPAALWALAGSVGLALRDLSTRAVPREVASLQVATWAFAAIVLAGLAMLAIGPPPVGLGARGGLLAAAMVGCGLFAYVALVLSTRIGEIAAVAPFRYSRILFALGLGIGIFGERPDALSLLGIALVVGSGLYTLLRESRRTRRGRVPPPSAGAAPGL